MSVGFLLLITLKVMTDTAFDFLRIHMVSHRIWSGNDSERSRASRVAHDSLTLTCSVSLLAY